jgi:hypothetical protein
LLHLKYYWIKTELGLAFRIRLVLVVSQAVCFADLASAARSDSDAALAEQENDPTARLTQFQIKYIYTPAEYGTNAELSTVQIRPIFAIRPFWLVPLDQILRPTIKVVTVPRGKGTSTYTAYDDMQLLDLFIAPWPNSEQTGFRWGIGPYWVFPTSRSCCSQRSFGTIPKAKDRPPISELSATMLTKQIGRLFHRILL